MILQQIGIARLSPRPSVQNQMQLQRAEWRNQRELNLEPLMESHYVAIFPKPKVARGQWSL